MSSKQDRRDPLHCMPVAEKFISVNGEGPLAGTPAAFIRFVGCNLACSYCDTAWACNTSCECEKLDAWQLCEWVANTGMHAVTVTGGEPLIHPLVGDLLRLLVSGDGAREIPFTLPSDLTVEVETNGAVNLQKMFTLLNFLPKEQADRIRFTVDYKLPSSGMEDEMCLQNYARLRSMDTVKFVVGSEADLERTVQVADDLELWGRVPVLVSPVAGSIKPSAIKPSAVAQFLIDNKLVYARLQLQLHKILWPGVDRGV